MLSGLTEPHFRIFAKGKYEEGRHQLISHPVFYCEALWSLIDEWETKENSLPLQTKLVVN
jgi:hypothetical protein